MLNLIDRCKRRLWLKLLLLFMLIGLVIMLYLDSIIRSTFTDKRWSVPSTVYARPLELYQGAVLTQDDLLTELGFLGYHFVSKIERPGQASVNAKQINIFTSGFQFSDQQEHSRRINLTFKQGIVSSLITNDNTSLVRLEPVVIGGIYPTHNEDRILVQLSEVPLSLQKMLVAVEDNQFYNHYGISLRSIGRALITNIKQGKIKQGASTLTQQLVKNYYLTPKRTLMRKAQEALMAMLLELHVSKSAILESYINEIYLGQDGPRAIHGFGLASQYYFKKSVTNLTLSEQALLVTLVRGASYYNPWRHPKRALKRRNLVLDISMREKVLSVEQVASAKEQPLGMGEYSSHSSKRYPAYLDLVRRQLQRDYNEADLSSDGLAIFTHFDPLIQASSESSLSSAIAKYVEQGRKADLQGAVVITRPNTGAVLALVGDVNARYAGFNRALDARRQIGSLIKPAVYLTALEQPQKYTLVSPISDAKYEQVLANGDIWSPQNYDHKEHGELLLYKALAKSYNQATARLGNLLGLQSISNTVQRLGFTRAIAELPAITLGAVEMQPIEVAQIYQTLSADGFYTPLQAISAVLAANGDVLQRYPLAVEKRFDAKLIYLLRYALQAVTHEGTAKALQYLLPDFAVAGKTGTTNSLRDSWFAGFSGDLLGVVWIGLDDNKSTGLTGASGALPVWANIFRQRSRLPIQNLPPEDIIISWVDADTGQGSQKSCGNAIAVPFVAGSEPKQDIRCYQGIEQVFDWFRDLVD